MYEKNSEDSSHDSYSSVTDSVELVTLPNQAVTEAKTNCVSNREVLCYLLHLNKDFIFKVKLVGTCVSGAIDVLTDVMFAFD